MIEPLGALGADRAFIVSKVVQRYNLTKEEAESKVDMYLPMLRLTRNDAGK